VFVGGLSCCSYIISFTKKLPHGKSDATLVPSKAMKTLLEYDGINTFCTIFFLTTRPNIHHAFYRKKEKDYWFGINCLRYLS
jgi:hypothetical protein